MPNPAHKTPKPGKDRLQQPAGSRFKQPHPCPQSCKVAQPQVAAANAEAQDQADPAQHQHKQEISPLGMFLPERPQKAIPTAQPPTQ